MTRPPARSGNINLRSKVAYVMRVMREWNITADRVMRTTSFAVRLEQCRQQGLAGHKKPNYNHLQLGIAA